MEDYRVFRFPNRDHIPLSDQPPVQCSPVTQRFVFEHKRAQKYKDLTKAELTTVYWCVLKKKRSI